MTVPSGQSHFKLTLLNRRSTMTNLSKSLDHFNSFFVGFDHIFNQASKLHDEYTKNIPHYPPYNVKKLEDNKYSIELAVAGFYRSDIEIEFADDKLIVRGNAKNEDQDSSYLFKGISTRAFQRTFSLNDSIEIKGAEMLNGILKIVLERIIPEHKKPKKIEIKEPEIVETTSSKKKEKQLLTEDK